MSIPTDAVVTYLHRSNILQPTQSQWQERFTEALKVLAVCWQLDTIQLLEQTILPIAAVANWANPTVKAVKVSATTPMINCQFKLDSRLRNNVQIGALQN